MTTSFKVQSDTGGMSDNPHIIGRRIEKTKKEKSEDRDANQFACAVLMPETIFLKEYRKTVERRSAPEEDEIINDLAKIFEVPIFAVVLRIQMLEKEINAVR